MPNSDIPQRIHNAVKECVEHCKSADSPLAAIVEFIGQLRTDPAWREAEIMTVQVRVAKYMARLHRGDE